MYGLRREYRGKIFPALDSDGGWNEGRENKNLVS
jgi:hypothetical protein